jgi:phage minor structural protein
LGSFFIGGEGLLTVTDLQGNTEMLVGFKGFGRNRKVNGERVIRFLLFPIPQNEHSFPLVKEESIIGFDGEEYRIKKAKKKSRGKTYFKEVVAIRTFFDLIESHEYVTRSGSMTFQAALDFVFAGTKYTYSLVDAFYAETFENFGDDNRLALFQEVMKRYGAEFELNGTHLTIKEKIGVNTDVQFRYKHNVKSVEEEFDTNNLSTYIKGFGKDGLEAEYISPNAHLFPIDTEDGLRHAKPIRDDRYTTYDGLLNRLKEELQDTPKVSVPVDFADLRKAGYPYQVANEGDNIFLIYEPMEIDLEARIMEIDEEFDHNLEPIKTKVTLANYKNNLTDQFVDFSKTQKQFESIMNNGKVRYNVLDEAVKRATESLQSAQTELEFENGIIARDKENPNRLVLLNSNGIGLSDDGGATFREAITADGFVLTAGAIGELAANNIDVSGIIELINAGGYTMIDGGAISVSTNTDFQNLDEAVGKAQTDADSAITKAVNAEGKADDANDQLSLWKYPGTSLIDGGDLYNNSVTTNKIYAAYLSAISADLGTVTAGSIRSNTSIDVETDAYIGRNIELGKYAFGGQRSIRFDGTNSWIYTNGGGLAISSIGALELDTAGVVTSRDETGFCGVGARDSEGITSALAGVGVNFRTKRTVSPSSVYFDGSDGNVSPQGINLSVDGFWLYINGTGGVGYKYWRGKYST